MRDKRVVKKLFCLILSLAMVVSPLSVSAAGSGNAAGTNYFTNGSFADGDGDGKADGWTYWNGTVAAAKSEIGESGLTISADSSAESQRLTVHQTVTGLEAGKTYTFSGLLNVLSTSKGSVEIRYGLDGSNTRIAYHTSKTSGWEEMKADITLPEGVTSIKFEIVVSAGATLVTSVKDFCLADSENTGEEQEGNLIVNPAYDTDDISSIPGWSYYPAYADNAGKNYEAEITSDHEFKGTVLGGSNMVLHQTVKLDADGLNKKYRFSGQIKTEDISGYASFRIQLVNSSNSGLGMTEPKQIKGTTDWTDIEFEFEVPEESGGTPIAGFKLEQYILKGTGTAWFRNVEIVEVGAMEDLEEGDPIDTLIFNGGYEKTASGFPASWSLWQSTGGLKGSSDREVFYEGYSSLHMENVVEGANSRGSVHQTFNFTDDLQDLQGQSVKMSQMIKTENFTGKGLSIRLHYTTKSGVKIEVSSKAVPVNATQDWTEYVYILDLPSEPLDALKVEYLYDECQGDVWVDNTRVEKYIKAKGIDVTPEALIMEAGEEQQMELAFTPESATVQSVTFSNRDDSVVSVSPDGLVKAIKNGVSTITIYQEDGVEKEVAVLVCDKVLDYAEEILISTRQNVTSAGSLPEGYNYEMLARPQHGTFLIENGNNYTYYPDKDYVGEDSVALLVSAEDDSGAQTIVVADLMVQAVNSAPQFDDFAILTTIGEPINGTLVAIDPENEELTFSIVEAPKDGVLTLEGNTYVFEPANGFTGYDSAIVRAEDENGNKADASATIYVADSPEAILKTVKTDHSRLLADDARFEDLRKLVETDDNAKAWFEDVKETVDALDDTPVPYECPDGVRLNTQGSKDVVNLAFVYRITGDEKYLDRAWVELDSMCSAAYPDWHPSHLLDTAMTANGVAIAYDWLYDYLTEEQRVQVEESIYEKGLLEAERQFDANHMFVTNTNNWNYVCNGGFATAALAMANHENEDYSNKAGEILQKCYLSIQYGLPQYAPEGDSIEGISYWDYGTRYLVSFLASVSSATNVENPFLNAPGIYETALYPIYMSGKAGTYNFSDNDMTDAVGYLNLWFAEVFDEPSYTWYHKDYMAKGNLGTIYDLLYYYPDLYEADAPEQLDQYYTSQAMTTMRHDFNDPNSSFLGFKGGLNGAPHGDIDIGSFVYDIYGVRWAFDFGKEDYNLQGYWEIGEGGTRWNYYRKNAMGHNTLVINPEKGANQTVGAYAGAVEQEINQPGGGYTILDMSDAYQDNAVDVKRGFAYLNRTQVLIRDEFILKEAGDIYWQMHTEANVQISEDGKTVVLTKDGKSIELRLFDQDGSDYRFETMAARPYEGIEMSEGENPNEGITKIFIKASGIQQGTFNVLLTPAGEENPEILPLDAWNEYDFSELKTDVPGSGDIPNQPDNDGDADGGSVSGEDQLAGNSPKTGDSGMGMSALYMIAPAAVLTGSMVYLRRKFFRQ